MKKNNSLNFESKIIWKFMSVCLNYDKQKTYIGLDSKFRVFSKREGEKVKMTIYIFLNKKIILNFRFSIYFYTFF